MLFLASPDVSEEHTTSIFSVTVRVMARRATTKFSLAAPRHPLAVPAGWGFLTEGRRGMCYKCQLPTVVQSPLQRKHNVKLQWTVDCQLKGECALLQNSAVTGRVDLSTRLKEMMCSVRMSVPDGQRFVVLDSVSVTVKCLTSHIHGEVWRLGYWLAGRHVVRWVTALFSRRSKRNVNRQCTYTLDEYGSLQRPPYARHLCYRHHLSSTLTTTQPGPIARASPGLGTFSTAQGYVKKREKIREDRGVTVPVSRPPSPLQRLPNCPHNWNNYSKWPGHTYKPSLLKC